MEPADTELKATNLAIIAKRHNWKGGLRHDPLTNETSFWAKRKAEYVFLAWAKGRLVEKPEYKLLQRVYHLPSQGALIEKLVGWPDIIKILKINRERNKPMSPVLLTQTYVRLPFDPMEDDDETIINALVGHKIWWYNSISGKIQEARVMLPKRKSQVFNIKPINHRRMFNFTEPDIGMRSVMLDQILKVQ